jgi:hypothetical protein
MALPSNESATSSQPTDSMYESESFQKPFARASIVEHPSKTVQRRYLVLIRLGETPSLGRLAGEG